MALIDHKDKDFPQTLKESYDPDLQRLRVDALVTDGIDAMLVNPDGSINVVTTIAPGSSFNDNLHDGVGNPITSSASSDSNRLIHSQTPDNHSATTTLNALNSTVSLILSGLSSIGFQLNAGTLIGTLQAQASVDGGTNWTNVPFYDPSNSAILPNLIFTSNNPLKIVSIVPIGGSSHVRVIVSSYTSGSATGLLRASEVTGAVGAITASAFGVVSNAYINVPSNTVTLLIASNVNRKFVYISNNSGSLINIQFGSSVGLSASTGLMIPSQQFYSIKGDNLFTGNVYGYSASTITVSVTEGTPG